MPTYGLPGWWVKHPMEFGMTANLHHMAACLGFWIPLLASQVVASSSPWAWGAYPINTSISSNSDPLVKRRLAASIYEGKGNPVCRIVGLDFIRVE